MSFPPSKEWISRQPVNILTSRASLGGSKHVQDPIRLLLRAAIEPFMLRHCLCAAGMCTLKPNYNMSTQGQASGSRVPPSQDRNFDPTPALLLKAVFPTIFNSMVVPRFGAVMS